MSVLFNLKNLALALCLSLSLSIPALAMPAKDSPVAGTNLGVAYLSMTDGSLQGKDLDTYFQPASTQKIFTALAALLLLGPDYRINTNLSLEEQAFDAHGKLKLKDGVLKSNLLLTFAGDPSFTSQKLTRLIQVLKTAGVKKIDGKVILDVSRFGGRDRGNGWSWNDLPVCFTAPASAVIINRNCAFAQLLPMAEGEVAEAKVPRGIPIEVVSRAVAVKKYSPSCELQADLYMGNRYLVSGCVPIQSGNKPWPLSFSVSDPLQWGVDWVKRILSTQQIEFNEIRSTNRSPEGYRILATEQSDKLYDMLRYMLQHSNNLYADAIAKTTAYEYLGTTATYARVAQAIVGILKRQAQIDISGANLVDGSGLSPHNLITPRQMLKVLSYIIDHDHELNFEKLLPTAGLTGTMQWRQSVKNPLFERNVTAKTGTLENVSNLAGFVTAQNGVRVPFVIFANGINPSQSVRDKIKNRRQANPHLGYERYLLEKIHAGKIMGRDF